MEKIYRRVLYIRKSPTDTSTVHERLVSDHLWRSAGRRCCLFHGIALGYTVICSPPLQRVISRAHLGNLRSGFKGSYGPIPRFPSMYCLHVSSGVWGTHSSLHTKSSAGTVTLTPCMLCDTPENETTAVGEPRSPAFEIQSPSCWTPLKPNIESCYGRRGGGGSWAIFSRERNLISP